MIQLLAGLAAVTVVAAAAASDGQLPTAQATMTLRLAAPADRAFPMFDPVNESRWNPEWHPVLLGDGKVAAGLVFTTRDGDGGTTWLLDRYDPAQRAIRYVVARTSTLTTIDIGVVDDGTQSSVATVRYRRTALDERGAEAVRAFAHHFSAQGPHWESAINAALART